MLHIRSFLNFLITHECLKITKERLKSKKKNKKRKCGWERKMKREKKNKYFNA